MPAPKIKCSNCQTEFQKRQLRCPSCKEIGVSKLYKYFRYDDYSLEMITEKTVWFQAAESLNDPFEFEFEVADMQHHGILVDSASLEEAKANMKKLDVLSLSETCDNVLMWSHYSDSHKGFCVEFERTDNNELGNWEHCIPVQYEDDLIKFKSIEPLNDKRAITKILITKSNNWSYELEWRMIATIGNKVYPLPSDIKGIIFGSRMSKDNQIQIAKTLRDNVLYSCATNSKDNFKVDVSSISFSDLMSKE